MCVGLCTCEQVPIISDALDVELQKVVSHLTWGFGPNQGPLEEPTVFLTADLSLQLHHLS